MLIAAVTNSDLLSPVYVFFELWNILPVYTSLISAGSAVDRYSACTCQYLNLNRKDALTPSVLPRSKENTLSSTASMAVKDMPLFC